MDAVKYIVMLAAGVWFIHALLNKPERVAILLFTCIVADINFDLKVIPLQFRALITLLLLAKVLSDGKKVPGASFLSTSYAKYIIFFVIYLFAITYSNGILDIGVMKEYTLSLMAAYLGYYFYMKEGGYRIFKISVIIAGLSCLGDLVWTYLQGGGLWIQRIYFMFTSTWEIVNHNFLGYICAFGFIFLLADYLADNRQNKKWNLVFMPAMFLGVLLSTSRSSLLMLIIITIVLIARGLMSKENSKKAYKLTVVIVSCMVLSLFLFPLLSTLFNIQSEFIEQITARLIEEPVAIFNRAMGNEFKADKLDSMDWRAEASERAYYVYMSVLDSSEQMFGIGLQGFMIRALGCDGIYDAHNGPLLMLIEFGVVGTLIYTAMLIMFFSRYRSLKLFSPCLVCMIYIL
ncbi:MAG TPA: O-antigen ligase family protein, partial [Chitinophagaceae bacterium]|nr:O-antigen ligase family protein [Chitinophagaceae bacterium]